MNEAPVLPRDHVEAALKLARRSLRHAWRGAIVLAVGIGLTAGAVALRPKRYTSQAVLLYQDRSGWDLQGESTRAAVQRLRELVLSRSRVQQVVQELGVQPRLVGAGQLDVAVEEALKRTTVRANETGTIVIAFQGASPEEAQRVTARLAELVIEEDARRRLEQVQGAKGFLDAQTSRNQEELHRKEAALAQFLARHPAFAQQAGPMGAGVRGAAEQVRSLSELQPDAEPPRASTPRPDPAAPLAAALAQAEASLAAARREHADHERQFTAKHPAMAAATARLREAEEVHRRAVEALAAATAAQGEAAPARRVLRAAARVPTVVAPGLVALETEYARLSREVADERERLERLGSKHFAASMAASSVADDAGRVTVIDPAYLPTRATGMSAKMLFAGGSLLATLLAVGACVAFAVLDDRVRDGDDVERLRLPPLLVAVPPLDAGGEGAARDRRAPTLDDADGGRPLPPSRPALALPSPGAGEPQGHEVAEGDRANALAIMGAARWDADGASPGGAAADGRPGDAAGHDVAGVPLDPRLVLLRAPSSPAAASFRVLRHRLAQRCRERPNVILVTSATAEEGKTTCALNLALALSEGGRAKVLLLDAHFRRPAITRALGLLELDAPEAWVAVEQITASLHVALDSQARSSVDEGSIASRVERLLDNRYDYLVIDGPPVLGSADANVLQESATSTVLTLRADRSEGSVVRRAIEQIGSEKLVGVVLMGA
jgi:uncharacterized protein involved in exopolysaccharide biosynthesis